MPTKRQDVFPSNHAVNHAVNGAQNDPQNYDDARAQFLALANLIAQQHPGSVIKSFKVPSPTDQNLYVDELFVPSKTATKSLLILTSGVHGLEASLGSAVQLQFMREFLSQASEKGVALWIVHCLNPYGFKYGRRNTEENINLNRNFGTTVETFLTPNSGYLKLAPHFEKKKKATGGALHKFSTLAFLLKRLFTKEFETRTLSQAISQGQFTNPKGLEFGGTEPTPQARYFRERFENLERPFEEIIMVDLHTGLGNRGRLHVLTGFDVKTCIHEQTFARLFQPEKEQHLYEFNSGDEKGFYQTIGDINTMIAELASQKKVVALTFEFGTLGNGPLAKADSLSRMWLENQGTHYGFSSPRAEKVIRQKFKELFEPHDHSWQKGALATTREVFARLVRRL